MITAQDIREKTFERKKVGGYDMDAVDDFLEELADDLTASQKEVAMLKSKMQVLVDKINEYRANEETLNMAILSAQKLAVQIETDARARAQAIIMDAQAKADAKIGGIAALADAEEKRLADAKAASAKYFEDMKALCVAQLENMEAIKVGYVPKQPEVVEAPVQPTIEDTVRSIESNVSRIQPEIKIDIPDMDIPAYRKGGFDTTQPFSL